jgi:hypothetical protein
MSCWVTPAVAAEFWGVTLDVVWDRIHCDMVPHKSEAGFVFIDVDPWTPAFTGRVVHQPPPTFVPSAGPELAVPVTSGAVLGQLDPEEEVFLSADLLNGQEESFFTREDREDELEDEGDFTDEPEEEKLPELDEEESATFGRLSWQDVRQSVARTRRPPPRAA